MLLDRVIRSAIRVISPGSASNLEPVAGGKSLSETKAPKFVSQVDVRVHQFRHRLCDPDGASVKATLDAIVKAGVLRNDGPEEVREVRFFQTKLEPDQLEYTRIEVEGVNDASPP